MVAPCLFLGETGLRKKCLGQMVGTELMAKRCGSCVGKKLNGFAELLKAVPNFGGGMRTELERMPDF